ncbi:UNVERIFIED_ORG: hypothetical protein GGD59_006311 [Rhizobium esperanzae]
MMRSPEKAIAATITPKSTETKAAIGMLRRQTMMPKSVSGFRRDIML